ncbi:MAG: LPS translocon maturation chaperone LptM [Betaproteobacteria bacterium]
MRSLASLLALLVLLAACGYKGPLYLPKPKPEAPSASPPAEDKKPKQAP